MKVVKKEEIKIYPQEEYQKLADECQERVQEAERGEINSIISVSIDLIEGRNSFPQNIDLGIQYLKLGINQSSVQCMEILGSVLINVRKNKIEEEEGVKILKKASEEHNSVTSKVLLVKYYKSKERTEPRENINYYEFKKYAKEAADTGNIEMMIQYGLLCEKQIENKYGRIDQNFYESFKYFKKAADLGDAEGLSYYAYYLQHPHGLFTPDIREAIKNFKLSIEKGSFFSMSRLAYCFINGNYIEKDLKEAFRLVEKSYDKGDTYSKYVFAFCMLYGVLGFEKDEEIGRYLMKKLAVDKNNSIAINDYALYLLDKNEIFDIIEVRKTLIQNGRYFYERDQDLFDDLRYSAAVEWDNENQYKSLEILKPGNEINAVYCMAYSAEILADIGKFDESKKMFMKASNFGDKAAIKDFIDAINRRDFINIDKIEINTYKNLYDLIHEKE